MRKPVSSSEVYTSHAATESRLAARSATPTVTVMTFETTRMRTESRTLSSSILQRILVMRTDSDLAGVTHTAVLHASTTSMKASVCEVVKMKVENSVF